jgi:hypothetical protein
VDELTNNNLLLTNNGLIGEGGKFEIVSVDPFPTTEPTLEGTSLVFGPGDVIFGKLLVLPIIPAGTFSTCSALPVSISMNLTRLPCIGSFGCAGAPEDWDPLIGLGDGTNLFAGELSDWYNGEGRASHSLDLGDTKSQVSWTSLFTDAGFPNIGESVDVDVVFILEDTETTVNLSFLDGSGNFTFSTALDCTAELSLLMFLDNDPGEQYQINSVTIPAPAQINVQIDIKPGSYPNSINLKSKGKVPVAILTTNDFDAYDVDPVTCVFAGADPVRWKMEDVDNDGDHDLLLHFKTQELNLTTESTEATLEGETNDGIQVVGTDSVNIVPKGKGYGKKGKKSK